MELVMSNVSCEVLPVVDLDVIPQVPPYLQKIHFNKPGGIFEWKPEKMRLYLSPKQEGDRRILGKDLYAELAAFPVFNATLLDFLLANKHLIPDCWKREIYILFWDTLFEDFQGKECVRSLYWGLEKSWASHYRLIVSGFNRFDYAIMRVQERYTWNFI